MLSSSGQVFIVTTQSLDTRKPHAIVTIMFRGCGYAFTSCRGGNIQTDCESVTRICKWGTIILAQASWQTNVPPLWGSCFLSQVIIIFPLFQLHQYPSTIPKNNITWDKKLTTTHVTAWQTYLEKIVFINSIDLLKRLQLNFSIAFTPTL